jgi:crossover junction endodeoxyribonuclease RusA
MERPQPTRSSTLLDRIFSPADGPLLVDFTLPWPPSVNRYWRTTSRRGRPIVLRSDEAVAYHHEAAEMLRRQGIRHPRYASPLIAVLVFFPPVPRKRDLDNVLKATFDTLQKAEVIVNDSQIRSLVAHFGPVTPDFPRVHVSLAVSPGALGARRQAAKKAVRRG